MGQLTPDEANTLAVGIREEWAALVSMLTEAADRKAWQAAGFDRPTEWLGNLPEFPPLPGISAPEPPKAPARRQASVSRPGAQTATTAAARREVNPMFKGGKKR